MNADQVINRVKKLKYFEIDIEVPPEVELRGKMPFSFRISNGVAVFKILAIDEVEAEAKLFDFLNNMDDYDDCD